MTRDRKRPLKIYVSETERAAIAARAQGCGLVVSDYLRAVGLGHEPRSIFDHEAVMTLARVNADQGRLGGLLKLWLSERPGQGASVTDVRRLLREIEATQAILRQLVERA
jgi:hypothetical protein